MTKDKAMKVGVVGCGNISGIYLKNAAWLDDIEIVACSDLDMGKAQAQAQEYGVARACTVDELMGDNDIDIVLNLTVPHAHAAVATQALESDKHVYGEKPLAVTREEARTVLRVAKEKKLRVGSAPDTFMGGAIQTCRKLIDDGVIGEPVAASAAMQCRGHETWHPNPGFYYQPGGGPMFDMGPYYITALIALLGPARRVTGASRITFPRRTITSKPKHGEVIEVTTATHISGTIDFENGAIATVTTSFDVCAHHLPCIEIYGSKGSISVPDPNSFGKARDGLHPIRVWTADAREWQEVDYTHGYRENSRGVGLADMARAIRTDRVHRADGEMAYHVLDIMQSFLDASENGAHVQLESTCARPAALAPEGIAD
ncbi:MAG: gfo/Idh/MocA family oxidoreductase [Chitinivibrionales bacterium]|nr:gfo/Idh/MocA family oxidoreductase [Chitinivibrionales bacterium]